MKILIIILSILNLSDYILTILNHGKFVEANPIMEILLENPFIITLIKIILVPFFLYILWQNRKTNIAKVGVIILIIIYSYAVVLGILYLKLNYFVN